MTTNSKKNETDQDTIPAIVCKVLSADGSWVTFQSSGFANRVLTKKNFNMVIEWLNKEKEKHPTPFE